LYEFFSSSKYDQYRRRGFLMPKQRTHRASAKRFSFTKTGKVKRACAYKSHILTKKTTKRTRKLRKGAYTTATEAKMIRKLVPYK